MAYGVMEYWSDGVLEKLPNHALTHQISLVPEKPGNRLLFSQYSSSPLLQYSQMQNSQAEPHVSDLAQRTRFSMLE